MDFYHKKTHQDQIWVSNLKEQNIVNSFDQILTTAGFSGQSIPDRNYGYPQTYTRRDQTVTCRFVDSVFLDNEQAWTCDMVITDNANIKPTQGQVVSALPEFWHIWQFVPEFTDRPARYDYNCFMNRISGDRSVVFYELIRRGLLDQGLVSFNCYLPGNNFDPADQTDYSRQNYNWQFESAELDRYSQEHEQGLDLVPYNTIADSLEQSVIDSRVSVVIETYTSDSHIVFSEKIFRALQLPRPWLLYCSPGSVDLLRSHGFDVLDDCVDHGYDRVVEHSHRLVAMLDQLEQLIKQQPDYQRYHQAAAHNQQLLKKFELMWPARLSDMQDKIQTL